MELNTWLFRRINGWPDTISPFMHFFSEATTHAWVRMVLGLIVLTMIFRGPRSRIAAIEALIAVAIGNFITDLFKKILPEYRPYQELHDYVLHSVNSAKTDLASAMGTSAHDAGNFGTASAHSANMAAVAFVFCYHLKGWGIPWVAIAIVTGLSRIYLGAHYPYQVVLGWTVGCVAAFGVTKSWDLYSRRKTESERNLESDAAE